jgi:ATP-dependent protease ClpP protease subunit
MRYQHPTNTVLNGDDDDDEIQQPDKRTRVIPYHYYEHTLTSQRIHFYVNESIGKPSLYSDMIHRINVASPDDVIYIHLNTPGGRLDTGVQIINAMRNSQAKIVTVLESTAYSLGTLIFLSGDEMVVNDHCIIMFHNFKGGVIGKGNELASELEATIKWFTALAKQIYIPFLSEKEFQQIIKGEDLWLLSSDIRKRLDNLSKEAEEKTRKRTTRKQKGDPAGPAVDSPPAAESSVES